MLILIFEACLPFGVHLHLHRSPEVNELKDGLWGDWRGGL
jgi:hypothetical protein